MRWCRCVEVCATDGRPCMERVTIYTMRVVLLVFMLECLLGLTVVTEVMEKLS